MNPGATAAMLARYGETVVLRRPTGQGQTADVACAARVNQFQPHEITGGVLQVLVRSGRVGRIRVQGSRWFAPRYVAGELHARPGQDVDARQLGNDLDWINRNPFRQVDLVYAKGSELGKTDLVLREVDHFPLRVYGGYEDSGTPVTGNNRLLAGINFDKVFASHYFPWAPPASAAKTTR